MRQRVAIAIALLHRPALIVCDEPTTALDVSIQAQILTEMRGLVRDLGTALIWISHDLATVSSLASRILVMYAGRIIEEGPTAAVLRSPRHPYSRGPASIACPRAPSRAAILRRSRAPRRRCSRLPEGCAFRPRCPRSDRPVPCSRPALERHGARACRCHHPLTAEARRVSALVEVRRRLEAVRAAAHARREDRGVARQRDRDAHGARASTTSR